MNTRAEFPSTNLIYIMTICAGFFALFGCSTAKRSKAKDLITNGSLTIQCEVREKTSYASGNLFGMFGYKHKTSYFNIKHLDKLVTIKTRNSEVAYFNQALFLKDAPNQTILAGSHRMYLITDDNGQADVKLLDAEQGDFGTFQWLDSDKGQPGKQEKIYQIDYSGSSRFLSGGRFLLINTRILLDVQTLKTYPIDNNSSELIRQLEGFNAFQSEVICFSPRQTQLVLKGYRRNPATNLSEYALVSIDIRTNKAYAIPFNWTDTRLIYYEDANSSWVSTFFDWTTNQDREEVLSLHSFEKLPYWKGHFKLHLQTDQSAEYRVTPVVPEMAAHFMQWIKDLHPTAVIGKRSETGDMRIIEFSINGKSTTLYSNLKDQTLTLVNSDKLMVKTIGEQFDKELAMGRFQDYFGRFIQQ